MPRGGGFLLCFLLCSLLSCIAAAAAAAGAAAPVRQGDALSKLLFEAATSSSSDIGAVLSNLKSRVHINPGSKEDDKIAELPGQPRGVDFDQYGGYVTVDGHNGRALFYYFVEAVGGTSSSRAKPLLLWLNGGPGCSSLGYGAMEELGPFRVASNGKTLYRNPYAWNAAANVLFLESPAGVGFSYSNTTSDYAKSGDQRTAEDALVFLLNWLERFPDYKGRDFYIAGESYAGHYVPQLADAILRYRRRSAAAGSSVINLKGIAIGNAVINAETDSRGMYDYFWTHALISDDTIAAIHESCNFSSSSFFASVKRQPSLCVQARQEADRVFAELDIYNIYAAPCFSSNVTSTQTKTNSIEDFDPCTDNYVDAYLNDPQVQRALHANVTKVNYTWSGCSQVILRWSDSPSTILPIIRRLLANGLRVLVYSGDIDGRVPVTSTRYSLNALNLTVNAPWRSWTYDNEVGGYTLMYEKNLTFTTVRGAGHEVPSYQPGRALAMIKSFLQGVQLPL